MAPAFQPVQGVQTVQGIQTVQGARPVQGVQPVQVVQPIQVFQPVQAVQVGHPVQTMYTQVGVSGQYITPVMITGDQAVANVQPEIAITKDASQQP